MKKFLLFFFMTVLLPMHLNAETIILKNGMKFESEKVWEENGEIKCYRNGLVMGFPKDEVERIEKTPPEAVEAEEPTASERWGYDPEGRPVSSEQKEVVASITPAAEQRSESNVDEIKQRLARIQQELHLEYQALMRELEQLESDKKMLTTASDRTNFSKSVLQYNQKAKNYEHKLKAFNKDVEAYKARVVKALDA
jgi:hypothetical protein